MDWYEKGISVYIQVWLIHWRTYNNPIPYTITLTVKSNDEKNQSSILVT